MKDFILAEMKKIGSVLDRQDVIEYTYSVLSLLPKSKDKTKVLKVLDEISEETEEHKDLILGDIQSDIDNDISEEDIDFTL